MKHYQVTNPATGKITDRYDTASDSDIQAVLAQAQDGYEHWQTTSLSQRRDALLAIAEQYQQQRQQLAAIITEEMGKPIAQALGEIDVVIEIFEYYAQQGERLLQAEPIEVSRGSARIEKRPIGVLLGIMPWNYPQYQVARFIAPNIMAGNSIILKHAEQCPKTATAIVELCHAAGLPRGVYNNVFATTDQVADMIRDTRVQGVSLTGSERAGAAVAATAGNALKKVVLELGGSDPFIVLADADIDRAVRHAINGRFENAGQACNAAKRLIIESSVYESFMDKFIAKVAQMQLGDPTQTDTFMGPMSSHAAAEGLQKQVDAAIAAGAKVMVDGGIRNDNSDHTAWFEPMVLTEVTAQMGVYRQELFGPVAVVHQVDGLDEMIALANDVPYGLGASIHGTDTDRIEQIAERLQVGMVTINAASSSEAETPFGGVKCSGFGRELGELGITEFINHKLIRDLSR